MKCKRLAVFALLAAWCAALCVLPATAAAEATAAVERAIGFSQMTNWADGGDDSADYDLKVCDLYFSRDVLMKANGSSIDYRINDGASYPSEDFSYVQQYLLFNGVSMKEINQETDTSSYVFKSFPSTVDVRFKVPIVIFSNSPEHLQIRIHKQYLSDTNAGDTFEIKILDGFWADALETNETLSGYLSVRFTLQGDVTFTKAADNTWSCDRALEGYVANEEVIDRADIDFSQIEYTSLGLSSVSDIIAYGSPVPVGGKPRQAQYLCIYFDRAISYQYLPYATMGKRNLKNLANSAGSGVELTQAQVDAIFDYRLDLSFNDHVKIDGSTIRECKRRELANPDAKIYLCIERDYVTLYLTADSANWLDPEQPHTIELTAGFRTPLFGELREDVKFYFDPEMRVWSKTDYAAEEEPVYDWTPQEESGSGCNRTNASTLLALLPMLAGLAFVFKG